VQRILITSNGVASYVASTVGAVVLDTLAVVNKVGQAHEGPAAEGSRVPLNGSVLGVFDSPLTSRYTRSGRTGGSFGWGP